MGAKIQLRGWPTIAYFDDLLKKIKIVYFEQFAWHIKTQH
jgi:hypothetical protein